MINDKMVSVPGAPVVGFPGAQGAPLQFGALLKARRGRPASRRRTWPT